MPACLVGLGLDMHPMNSFAGRLLPRLGNVVGTLSQNLPMLLLFVNDFLIVRYISWI